MSNQVQKRTARGLTYVYDFSDDKKTAKDWRSDGSLWRQTGKNKYKNPDGSHAVMEQKTFLVPVL